MMDMYDYYYGEATLDEEVEYMITEFFTENKIDGKFDDADYDYKDPDDSDPYVLDITCKENGEYYTVRIKNICKYDAEAVFDMWMAEREERLPEIYYAE